MNRGRARAPGRSGFTLLELVIAVSIGALLIQLAVSNLGALIPSSTLDSETNQFVSRLDFLRSEAKLNGKPYRMELDLSKHCWRTVLPPEERLLPHETLDDKEFKLSWTALHESVEFAGYLTPRGVVAHAGIIRIEFDEHGFTGDHTVLFRLRHDKDYVWTVRLRGLTGQSTVQTSVKGQAFPFDKTEEASF
jgi:prepilin-type N-terminal cleavage/methylation domain-containing protein